MAGAKRALARRSRIGPPADPALKRRCRVLPAPAGTRYGIGLAARRRRELVATCWPTSWPTHGPDVYLRAATRPQSLPKWRRHWAAANWTSGRVWRHLGRRGDVTATGCSAVRRSDACSRRCAESNATRTGGRPGASGGRGPGTFEVLASEITNFVHRRRRRSRSRRTEAFTNAGLAPEWVVRCRLPELELVPDVTRCTDDGASVPPWPKSSYTWHAFGSTGWRSATTMSARRLGVRPVGPLEGLNELAGRTAGSS